MESRARMSLSRQLQDPLLNNPELTIVISIEHILIRISQCKFIRYGRLFSPPILRSSGGVPYEGGSASTNDTSINIPLGPGEWDEPLGLPLCVACHGVCMFLQFYTRIRLTVST